MLSTIYADGFNAGRFFKIYGSNGADIAAWAHPQAQDHKQLLIANQNLAQENFRNALESLMDEFSENAAMFRDGYKGTGSGCQ